jgi:DNA repair protein RadC
MDEITFVRVGLEVLEVRPVSDIREILLGPPCRIQNRAQETVWVATYNAAGNLFRVAMVAQGGFDQSHVSIPALMTTVALSGGDRFLIAHNHPNGPAYPSGPDGEMTLLVARASDAIGYTLEDHLVFDSRGRSFSMAGAGLLTPRQPPVLRLERSA